MAAPVSLRKIPVGQFMLRLPTNCFEKNFGLELKLWVHSIWKSSSCIYAHCIMCAHIEEIDGEEKN